MADTAVFANDENLNYRDRAEAVLPGGVASVNRLISKPIYFNSANGAEVTDVAGNTYVDYNCAFGATIIGHADPRIANRVAEASEQIGLIGLGGTDTEVALATKLLSLFPNADRVNFCNSGAEATYHALRICRADTGRQKIIKFQGGYHGWHDAVAMNVMTPENELGSHHRMSAGMMDSVVGNTFISEFNNEEQLESLFASNGHEVAAVIVEMIMHNVGCILPTKSFLKTARRLCDEYGAKLIFDEVITGFRHALNGYQSVVGVIPDITTIGKAVANGFPIAALMGKENLMKRCRPSAQGGDIFMAGTYNGHPVMCAAALATIEQLEAPGAYDSLFEKGDKIRSGLNEIADRLGFEAQAAGYGSVWLLYFFKGTYTSFRDLLANDSDLDRSFREGLVERGFISSTNPLKRWNFTLAHTDEHIDRTLQAAEDTLRELKTR